MKYRLFAVLIGLPTLAVADVASWSSHQTFRAQLESLYRCQWLTAGSEEEPQRKKSEAGGIDEPDCA